MAPEPPVATEPPVPLAPPVLLAPPVPPEPPHEFADDAELRGFTVPAAKSAELLSVSMQPALARSAEVVLPSVGVGPLPSKLDADEPYPTKSAMLEFGTQDVPQVSAVWFRTKATLPLVALILSDPVASGVGRFVVPPLPAASFTR